MDEKTNLVTKPSLDGDNEIKTVSPNKIDLPRKTQVAKSDTASERSAGVTSTGGGSTGFFRYAMAMLIFAGFIISYGLTCNASAATDKILDILTRKRLAAERAAASNTSNPHYHHGVRIRIETTNNITRSEGASETGQKFEHNAADLMAFGFLESSFFWTFATLQIPGSFLTVYVSTKYLFGCGILLSSIFNAFAPLLLRYHYSLGIFMFVLSGGCQSIISPAAHTLLSKWAPKSERSKLVNIAYSGMYVGLLLGTQISNLMVDYWIWDAAFITFAVAGVIWFAIWAIFSADNPQMSAFISEEEQLFIAASQMNGNENSGTADDAKVTPSGHTEIKDSNSNIDQSANPYANVKITKVFLKGMVTSGPVYAILASIFVKNWVVFILVIMSRQYFEDAKEYFGFTGDLLIGIPFLMVFICSVIGAMVADLCVEKGWTVERVRKTFNSAFLFSGFCFAIIAIFDRLNENIVLMFFTLSFGGVGVAMSGFNVNHIDIASRYCGIVQGFANGLGSFAKPLIPITIDIFLVKYGSRKGWSIAFGSTTVFCVIATIIFIVLAKGEEQPWARAAANGGETKSDGGETKSDEDQSANTRKTE